ncbi:steroid C27-monooxygenase domain protein [Mycobacterium xenopi 4042]|uniref:Steroid C27-monooxygenase domain protein n=1 Tax=Mycobacterium xenopi 4042 TaxID=1299334 RepID=X8BGU6_MYCXE|nr:steroid C27-monooxygenase domain protein [Mycobacterium xenopi 4042]
MAPIWWNEQPLGAGGFDDGGFWVVTKHKDVKEISLRSDVFSSLKKTALPRYKDGTVGEQVERGKFVLLNMDAPSTPGCARSSREPLPRGRWSACATI